MPRQVRLLARHFFWRFFDNDLVSPDSDAHETGALFMAFLAVPGLLGTGLLLFKYASPWVTPYERLVLALPDKFLYIAWSMLVMALVTVAEWDALALDERDYAILGALPLASSTLLAGKLASLALFVAAVAVAVNAIPALFFPLVYMSSNAARMPLPTGLWMVLRMMVAHAVSCAGASVFAFLVLMAVRSALVFALGPRLFRRVSLPIQLLSALALVIAFFNSYSWTRSGRAGLSFSPPAWFLGLYEAIAGRLLPGVPPDTALLTWQVSREHRAQEAYAAVQPLFPQLAQTALVAVAAVAVIGFAAYFASHLRHASRLRQPATAEPAARRGRLRLESALRRFLVRDPLAQASFFFTWRTLMRSSRHKLIAGAYVAAGVLLCYTTVAALVVRPPVWTFLRPAASVLAVQFVLCFFLLVGLRVAFTVPAELRANWIFRLTTGGEIRRYLSGVRRLLVTLVIGPLFIALVPCHALLWGWRVALVHAGFGVLWALILADVLLLGLEKLPFTCSHVSGKGNVKLFWPIYLIAFAIYVYTFAAIEAAALRSVGGTARLGAVLVALLAGIALYRGRLLSQRTVFVFDDLSDATPVTLRLY